MNVPVLDLGVIQSTADCDAIIWESFADEHFPNYVKHLLYPVSGEQLDRVCKLAESARTVRLGWSMGDLYFTRTFQRPLL